MLVCDSRFDRISKYMHHCWRNEKIEQVYTIDNLPLEKLPIFGNKFLGNDSIFLGQGYIVEKYSEPLANECRLSL